MPKYVIERTVPGAGEMDAEALMAISGKSNEVLHGLGVDIQWIQSYVVDDTLIIGLRAPRATWSTTRSSASTRPATRSSSVSTAGAAASRWTPSTPCTP